MDSKNVKQSTTPNKRQEITLRARASLTLFNCFWKVHETNIEMIGKRVKKSPLTSKKNPKTK